MEDEYLIWSNEHAGWWRPGSRGYARGLKSAGRYSREEALRICRQSVYTAAAHIGRISEIPVRVADVLALLTVGAIPREITDDEGTS